MEILSDQDSNIKILNQYGNIKNNKIHEYLVDLELSFYIDDNKQKQVQENQDNM